MKKISTLLLSSLFSLSLLAFDGSRLSISAVGTSANAELKIEIDGRQFSMKNNSITVGYLGEGRHDVKIYKEAKRTRNDFGRREIIFNKSITLKRGFHLDITVNRFGKVMLDEQKIDTQSEWYSDEDEYYDHEGWDNSMNKMSVREFEQLKESLRKEWFENNRLTSVKYVLEKSNFTTYQVKDLMLLFAFESNRLEIAKAAFRKTIDKENYYLLNEALTFSSSKEDLARFIRESRY